MAQELRREPGGGGVTRIVVDPEELTRVAASLHETADFFSDRARRLGSGALPPMPSFVAANVASGLDRVAASLERVSIDLRGEALMLNYRAKLASGDIPASMLLLWNALIGGMADRLFPEVPEDRLQAAGRLSELVRSDASPVDVARFFALLTQQQRDYLVRAHPELVGGTDGAPFELRYEANRALMARTAEALEERRRALTELMEDVPPGLVLEIVQESVDAIDERLDDLHAWMSPDRHFLLFDPRGDGRIAEVHGDLEAAEIVAVLVPGMNNDAGDFETGLSPDAALLHREAEFLSGKDVAAIMWLGYDTPEWASAAFPGAAEDGARALPDFVRGIEAFGDKTVSVVGHSYGSLVTGVALKDEGLRVDDAVFLGSPGVGVTDRDDLGPGAGGVWAAKAEGDLVPLAPVHGEDPTDEGFGATRFETGESIEGHSSYYERGSESLRNIALIVTQLDEFVTKL